MQPLQLQVNEPANNQQQKPVDPNVQAIQNNMAIIQQLPTILQTAQLRVSKSSELGAALMKELEVNNNVMNDTIFEKFKTYIIKCRDVKTELEASRKPGTQSFDLIKGMFTAEERKIDIDNKESFAYKFQQLNNKHLADKKLQEQKEEAERQKKIAKDKEAVSIRADFGLQIGNSLLRYQNGMKSKMSELFNQFKLESFDDSSNSLRSMIVAFPEDKINSIIKIASPPQVIYHTPDEINIILQDVWQGYDFASFKASYVTEITNEKNGLIARLPAKKEELQQLAIADQETKTKLENEQKQREEQQRLKQEKELQQQQQQLQDQAKQQESAGHVQTLFTNAANVNVEKPADSKTSVVITVNNHAGTVEVFTLWFQLYAKEYTVEQILNKKLSSMVTDLQKEAKKDKGLRIAGTNVTYSEETVSVNRKQKANGES